MQKILNGSQKERADASAVFRRDEILSLYPTYKKSLIESTNDDYDTSFLIGLSITGEGGSIILPVLMKKLMNAQVRHDGCEALEIFTGVHAIAKQKATFSQEHISIIKALIKSPLGCGMDDSMAETGEIVLELLKTRN